eukprot:4202711-Amphidinium_carterae.1
MASVTSYAKGRLCLALPFCAGCWGNDMKCGFRWKPCTFNTSCQALRDLTIQGCAPHCQPHQCTKCIPYCRPRTQDLQQRNK